MTSAHDISKILQKHSAIHQMISESIGIFEIQRQEVLGFFKINPEC